MGSRLLPCPPRAPLLRGRHFSQQQVPPERASLLLGVLVGAGGALGSAGPAYTDASVRGPDPSCLLLLPVFTCTVFRTDTSVRSVVSLALIPRSLQWDRLCSVLVYRISHLPPRIMSASRAELLHSFMSYSGFLWLSSIVCLEREF